MTQWLGRFKTRSNHSLNLFLVVPGSASQMHLQIVNLFASGQLGFLTVVVVVFCSVVHCVSLALKSPYGERSIKYVLYCMYKFTEINPCLAGLVFGWVNSNSTTCREKHRTENSFLKLRNANEARYRFC